jgi:hypothetical protein
VQDSKSSLSVAARILEETKADALTKAMKRDATTREGTGSASQKNTKRASKSKQDGCSKKKILKAKFTAKSSDLPSITMSKKKNLKAKTPAKSSDLPSIMDAASVGGRQVAHQAAWQASSHAFERRFAGCVSE